MPIRPELRQFYGREWHTVIRPRILKRARDRCEQCRIPNHETAWRVGASWRVPRQTWWRDEGGRCTRLISPPTGWLRKVRIVLTIAHLNHDPADNRDENLMALCQWCHLHHDRAHHKDTRRGRKDARRPLLAGQEAA